MTNSLGYCPKCNAPGKSREKRPNGNDKCENGHTYPSKEAEQIMMGEYVHVCPSCGDTCTITGADITFCDNEDDEAFAAESDDEVLDLIGR